MRRIPVLLAAVLTTAVLTSAVLTTGALGGAAAAPEDGSGGRAAGAAAATFRNPLDLRLPNGQQAANCADPVIVRGVGDDRDWYLYCTTDAIDETEREPDGEPVQHLVPTYRSTDLVRWTYTGDAFAEPPAWLPGDAGVWAPEVVHRAGRWYLYYTAPETLLPGGGSAIGVATSDSPTGPWVDSGGPVVAPAGAESAPGEPRWAFDPEVVTSGGRMLLYFGSYFGGLFVRELAADGLTSLPSSERRVGIANRYEGTNVVRRGGWYYLLGSATNCCAGALTGYSVFAARSRSPFGPFRDADGRSILDARVGGTPVLSLTGNRWIGAGHHSVLTDRAGQDWIVYHAVDRGDPVVAGTTDYTKRAALLDPLDWRDGWPVVRGGRGPSDSAQPAPTAQPGQRDAVRTRFTDPPRPGRRIAALSDDFDGSALDPRWSWVRKPAVGEVRVAGGRLVWRTQDADIHPPDEPLASVLTERAPAGDWVVEAKVRTTVPTSGDEFNFVQGGLVVYDDDGHYVKLSSAAIFETRQTEFGLQDSSQPAGAPTYGNGVVGPVGSWTWLRITRRTIGGETAYTASTSVDGRTFRTGITWATDLGPAPRIGLVSLGGAGFETLVDHVRVSRLR